MGRTDKKKQARKKREAENKVPTIAEQLLELEARGIPNIVEAIEDADWLADDVSDDEEESVSRFAKGHRLFNLLLAKNNHGGLDENDISTCTKAFTIPTTHNFTTDSWERKQASQILLYALDHLPAAEWTLAPKNHHQEKQAAPETGVSQMDDRGAEDLEMEDADADYSDWEGSVSGELEDMADLNVESDMESDIEQ